MGELNLKSQHISINSYFPLPAITYVTCKHGLGKWTSLRGAGVIFCRLLRSCGINEKQKQTMQQRELQVNYQWCSLLKHRMTSARQNGQLYGEAEGNDRYFPSVDIASRQEKWWLPVFALVIPWILMDHGNPPPNCSDGWNISDRLCCSERAYRTFVGSNFIQSKLRDSSEIYP